MIEPTLFSTPSSEATSLPAETPAAILAAADIDNMPPPSAASFAGVLEVADKWGSEWARLVAAFVSFEREAGFNMQELRLPSSELRPPSVKTWYSQKRAMKGNQWEELGTGDGAAFGTSWWAWWTDIQPAGREVGGDTMHGADGSLIDWRRLCKSGPTGIFVVLITLVWWKMKLEAEDDSSWKTAMRDVQNVLERLRQPEPTTAAPKKRK